jgi:hypothetical protein
MKSCFNFKFSDVKMFFIKNKFRRKKIKNLSGLQASLTQWVRRRDTTCVTSTGLCLGQGWEGTSLIGLGLGRAGLT